MVRFRGSFAFALLGLFLALFVVPWAKADLRTPGWWDPDGVSAGQDWHYRVPVTLPSASTVNSSANVDVNFTTLMGQLGISGTFDPNSVRVVRPNGTIATIQQFTDTIYAGATDSSGNAQGEVRWLVEDGGAQTYYIYFDITQNGAKSANPQTPINGNFEFGSVGTQLPPGWGSATKSNAVYDMQIRPSETVSVTSDGIRPSTGTGPLNSPRSTDGTPKTGAQSYLVGARTNNEAITGASQPDATVLTRTIAVPATNPGSLTFRWRVEGWDSDTNSVTSFDHLSVDLIGSSTTNVVGPLTTAYATYPFAPSYGANDITSARSGYGDYNTFDMRTTGVHTLGMTVANHAEPWWTRTVSLAAYAGQTITLRIETTHYEEFKTWFSLDDIEWSIVSGTLGNAEAFGTVITAPVAGSTLAANQTLAITARVDAKPTAATNPVTADVYDSANTLVASGIILYNDGTHGDAVAGDAFWTNDGSVPLNPTYTIPGGQAASTNWTIRVFAKDASTSTVGAAAGLLHRVTLPIPAIEANYWNIDEILFNTTRATLSVSKVNSVVSDPVNNVTNPKAIPGAVMLYCITVTNAGPATASQLVATDPLPPQITFVPGSIRSGATCAAASTVEDDNATGADETDPFGASFAGTTLTANAASLATSASFAIAFNATVN